MSRDHAFHCPTCHTWVDAWTAEESGFQCSADGAELFYDLNMDGCDMLNCFALEGCSGVLSAEGGYQPGLRAFPQR